MIRAIGFDFDDTISDWPGAVREAAIRCEVELSLAGGAERFLERAFAMFPGREPGPLYFRFEEVFAAMAGEVPAGFGDRFREAILPVAFHDALMAIPALAARLPLAVLSNNPYAPEGLRRLGMAAHFQHIVAIDEASGLAKPHPSAYGRLLGALNLEPHEVLYVGDSLERDVHGPVALGMHAAWVDRAGSAEQAPAGSYRIRSLHELEDVVAAVAGEPAHLG